MMQDKPDGQYGTGDVILGRYKVVSEFEMTGLGSVYKCFDETTGLEIALKALPRELTQDPVQMEKILKSFRTVHNLHHPHIASCDALDKDPATGNYYVIMECVEGETLRAWMDRKRREKMLNFYTALRVIRQTAEALDCANRRNIIHEGLKPENILIDKKGDVKVLDFGLGTLQHSGMTREEEAYSETSASGAYMAPEQWQGRTLGAAADQYALAVITYEMLSGHLPFENTDPMALRESVLNDSPKDLKKVPDGIREAVLRAMSKNPAERFTDCADFVAALEGENRSNVTNWSEGKSNSIVFALLLMLVAGFCIGFKFFQYLQPKKSVEEKMLAEPGPSREPEGKLRAELMARRAAEEKRLAEAEALRVAEEKRLAEEKIRKAAEEKLRAEEKIRKAAEEKLRAEEKIRKAAEEKRQTEKLKGAADLYRKGREYDARKEYVQASECYRQAAEQGNAAAQFRFGLCCHTGRGVMKDLAKAVMWYRKASEQGNADAAYMLGFCYENGRGVEKDIYDAVKCYRSAADKGNADAQYRLGVCCEYGRGLEKNLREAAKWYYKAAEQGNAAAQFSLGVCYYLGLGVEKDISESVMWYRKAAEQGNANAQFNLGTCYFYGHGVEKNLHEAVSLYRKAAEQRHAAAQFNLAQCYEYGYGVQVNHRAAAMWYRRAAERGNANAQKRLKQQNF